MDSRLSPDASILEYKEDGEKKYGWIKLCEKKGSTVKTKQIGPSNVNKVQNQIKKVGAHSTKTMRGEYLRSGATVV